MGKKMLPFVIPVVTFLLGGACGVLAQPALASAAGGDAEIDRFLQTYFTSWSQSDFKTYGDLFHPQAEISFVQNGRVTGVWKKDAFLDLQRATQAASPATERFLSRSITRDAQGATVVAAYELKPVMKRPQRGVDRFTLIRDSDGEWRILYLVFYLTR